MTTVESDERDLAAALYRALSTEDGRVLLVWLMDKCGLFERDSQKIQPERMTLVSELMDAAHLGIAGDAGVFADALLASYTKER